MSNRHESYLDLARKVAGLSDCRRQHGAVLVRGGRVLSLGNNKLRNDPRYVLADTPPGEKSRIHGVHAEAAALRGVDARGGTLYIARINRKGEDRMSRPCNNCMEDLIKAGITQVVYTIG